MISKNRLRFIKQAFTIFYLIVSVLSQSAGSVYAATSSWDFSNSSNYTFDNTKIEISATTKPILSLNNLSLTDTTVQAAPEKPKEETVAFPSSSLSGYTAKIKVTDTANQPVEGAKVTIHSKVQEGVTGKDGYVTFDNVEKGDHRVIIAYKGFQGEQALNLSGNTTEYSMEIKVTPQKVVFSSVYLISVGVAAGIIIVLIVLLLRKRD